MRTRIAAWPRFTKPCTWTVKPSRSAHRLPARRGQTSSPRTLNTWLIRGRWSRKHSTTRRPRPIQRWPIFACRNFYPAGWIACTSSSFIMWALNPLWMRTGSARFVIRRPLQELRVVHARAWKPNGSVLDAQELGDREYDDTLVSTYYDARLRQLRFSRTGTGRRRGNGILAHAKAALCSLQRLFRRACVICRPKPGAVETICADRSRGAESFCPRGKNCSGHGFRKSGSQIFVWEAHSVAALPREPRSPGATEISPYVHVSTLGNWQQLGAWYADLIRPQFALDQSLESELARVTNGLHSDKEKIAAIQEFVLRSTHYVALEFGVYSYKPYPVTQIYARRFGDCKDKASLMIALLRAAGIEADIALVRTRSLGDVVADPHP